MKNRKKNFQLKESLNIKDTDLILGKKANFIQQKDINNFVLNFYRKHKTVMSKLAHE